jgi:hypothetical protein
MSEILNVSRPFQANWGHRGVTDNWLSFKHECMYGRKVTAQDMAKFSTLEVAYLSMPWNYTHD